MKKCMILVLLTLFVFSLSACCIHRKPDGPMVRVVTRITISQGNDTRSYASDESLRAILSYLRHLKPHSKAETAPTMGSIYQISLIYSDGSRQEFRQRGHFFQEDSGTWRTITEQDALNLSKLFNLLEPESVPSAI